MTNKTDTKQNFLFTFAGKNDPFDTRNHTQDNSKSQKPEGPILDLLKTKTQDDKFYIKFDKIYIVQNNSKNNRKWCEETLEEIRKQVQDEKDNLRNTEKSQFIPMDLEVKILKINDKAKDPTDHFSLLNALFPEVKKIQKKHENANFYASIASGTPAMHAIWMLLFASKEIQNLKILKISDRKTDDDQNFDRIKQISIDQLIENLSLNKDIIKNHIQAFKNDFFNNLEKLKLLRYGYHPNIDILYSRIYDNKNNKILISGKKNLGKKSLAKLYADLNGKNFDDVFIQLNKSTQFKELKAKFKQLKEDFENLLILKVESVDFLADDKIKNLITKKLGEPDLRIAILIDDEDIAELASPNELLNFFMKSEQKEPIYPIQMVEELHGLSSPIIEIDAKKEIVKQLLRANDCKEFNFEKIKTENKNKDQQESTNIAPLLNQPSIGALVANLKLASDNAKKLKKDKITIEILSEVMDNTKDKFTINSLNLENSKREIVEEAFKRAQKITTSVQNKVSDMLGVTQQQVSKLKKLYNIHKDDN